MIAVLYTLLTYIVIEYLCDDKAQLVIARIMIDF